MVAITVIANPRVAVTVALTWLGLCDSVSGEGRVTAPAGFQATVFATVSPKAEGGRYDGYARVFQDLDLFLRRSPEGGNDRAGM